jgi:hypothetical protein
MSFVCAPELEIQKFLRAGNTLNGLKEKFMIRHKRHNQYSNLVTLKYTMGESPFGEKLVQECRGLILDQDNNWEIVAHPFTRFFNYNEEHAAVIDWKTAKLLEKLDGSLCIVYFYDNKWHVGTSGTPDAAAAVGDSGLTFHELFWETWDNLGYKNPDRQNWTYMFELMTIHNKVVITHKNPRIVLIGIRNLLSGKEIDIHLDSYNGNWEIVKSYDISNLDSAISTFRTMDPLKQEGYVVVSPNHDRIKIKHPGYVAIHHAGTNPTVSNFLQIVRSGEIDEAVGAFPEWADTIFYIKGEYTKLIQHIEEMYPVCVAHMGTRKDFALKAKETRIPSIMFSLLDRKVDSIKEYLANMNLDALKAILGLNNYKVCVNYKALEEDNGN